MADRLQKILAEGGFGSRRECETLILEGRVEVDREIVTKLGTRVDAEKQTIRVDGQKLKISFKKYYAVNKPRGVVSTSKDPSGRPRVIDLIPTDQRVYNVGRLDKDSEGLIIVTNDGALANRLTHPRYGIEKTYLVQVEGHPTREQMESLVAGVYLADGFVQIKQFQFKRKQKHTTEIEIVLDEGRNREIRRLLAKIGHKVLFLRRVAIGSYVMEGIPFGASQQLTADDVELLTTNPKRHQTKGGKKARSTRSSAASQATTPKRKRTAGTGAPLAKGTSGTTRAGTKKSALRKSKAKRGSEKSSDTRSKKRSVGKRSASKTTGSKKKVAGSSKAKSSKTRPSQSGRSVGGRGSQKASTAKTTRRRRRG